MLVPRYQTTLFEAQNSYSNYGLPIMQPAWKTLSSRTHYHIQREMRRDAENSIASKIFTAFLFYESRLFVYPHKLICKIWGGTTTLFYGVDNWACPEYCWIFKNMVWRVFYSHSFMVQSLQNRSIDLRMMKLISYNIFLDAEKLWYSLLRSIHICAKPIYQVSCGKFSSPLLFSINLPSL